MLLKERKVYEMSGEMEWGSVWCGDEGAKEGGYGRLTRRGWSLTWMYEAEEGVFSTLMIFPKV